MYNVCFATGSRADYGIVRSYLRKLNEDANINLDIIATGAMVSSKYGHTVDLVKEDGFFVAEEIDIDLNSSNVYGTCHSMSIALDRFAALFQEHRYDLLIILGDRYEMMSVAIAAAMQGIPILHIHGGEITWGNYDEFIRHSITKMSRFHITATEEYRQRVIQLGENPNSVFFLGSLGAENCDRFYNLNKNERNNDKKPYYVVLFHPETLTSSNPLEQINQVLQAVSSHKEYEYYFVGSNADTNSEYIRNRVKEYVADNNNAHYVENLKSEDYYSLLMNSVALIGNSSSGIIEAPSLRTYTINIGDRQGGRARGNSVIDVLCAAKDIMNAMESVSKMDKGNIKNPYLKENAVNNYYEITMKILDRISDGECISPKHFFDR